MQSEIDLVPEDPVWLPFSYFDKMASALYLCLHRANECLSADLHDGRHANRIKVFGFSPLHSQEVVVQKGGRGSHRHDQHGGSGLIFKGRAVFRVCTPWPELMNALMEGLLQSGELRVGTQLFRVSGARLLPPPPFAEVMTWRPFGPGSIVTSWSDRESHAKLYTFPDRTPECSPGCLELLRDNLVHKWRRLAEIRPDLLEAWAGQTSLPEQAYRDIAIELASTTATLSRDNSNGAVHARASGNRDDSAAAPPWGHATGRESGVVANPADENVRDWPGDIDDAAAGEEPGASGKTSRAGGPGGVECRAPRYKTRLHQVKSAPVRSWQAAVRVRAPLPFQRLVWSCGLGEMNSMGFGLMEAQNR